MVILKVDGAVKQACSLCPPTQHFAQRVYQMAALYQGVALHKARLNGNTVDLATGGSMAVAIVWKLSTSWTSASLMQIYPPIKHK